MTLGDVYISSWILISVVGPVQVSEKNVILKTVHPIWSPFVYVTYVSYVVFDKTGFQIE